MNNGGGKGSWYRPVNRVRYEANYDLIFRKDELIFGPKKKEIPDKYKEGETDEKEDNRGG